MDNLTAFKGMILGMENMGAKFVKTDGFDVFFNISKGSDIDDEAKLKRAKKAFTKMLGLGLKVRMINIDDVICPFNCIHLKLKNIGYSDLYYCEDCESKIAKIKDNNRVEGYRYEPKD